MSDGRKRRLEKNFFKIFFINSLLNVKMVNAIISLFYVYRSLTVADIFYLGIVYSVAVIASEVPSSYLADRFGRKRTIVMATFFGLLHWVFYLVADSFVLFAVGTICYALTESCMSGTDEAFVFDSNKELGNHSESLKKIARYFSSERLFKIFSAFLGAVIAKDLADWQFSLIILVDIVASVIALVYAFTLTEPNHYIDVEKQEAGIIKDAYKILINDKNLLRAIFNKLIILILTAACWRYAAVLFVENLHIPIIIFGFLWSVYHMTMFVGNYFAHAIWSEKPIAFKIDSLNVIICIALLLFLLTWFLYPERYIMFGLYIIIMAAASLRDPFFSHLFNMQFSSYNRATTLSLANFVRHILEVPFLLVIAWAVNQHIILPYAVALLLGGVVIVYFPIKTGFNDKLYA
ncbi:MAG: MFS transporter [Candidatus Magasanikbacteria bacterium]|nr:MFS transporter [Candidatus Magasanikbacteria bacterium]